MLMLTNLWWTHVVTFILPIMYFLSILCHNPRMDMDGSTTSGAALPHKRAAYYIKKVPIIPAPEP